MYEETRRQETDRQTLLPVEELQSWKHVSELLRQEKKEQEWEGFWICILIREENIYIML